MNVALSHGVALCFSTPSVEGRLTVSFHRTLRVPDDGREYPLPPSLGPFPLRRVEDYADRVPREWLETAGIFLPLYQSEAMWIQFGGRSWHPNAVKVGAGGINSVTGKPWSLHLQDPQDYLVCPPQPWLDGFNTGANQIRQFVAAPLGQGLTVEGQLTGREVRGGIQLLVCAPKRGLFPTRPPRHPHAHHAISVLSLKHAEQVLDRLVERRLLSAARRRTAEKRANQSGCPVLQIVKQAGWIEERKLLAQIAHILGLGVLDPEEIDPEALRLVPEFLCRRYGCIPISVTLNRLRLAVIDPLDILAQDDVALVTGYDVEPVLASEAEIAVLLEKHYGGTELCEVEETVKDISAQDFGPMGLGCGGTLTQQIFPDPHGRQVWSRKNQAEVEVHLVNSRQWTAITGESLPPTPVDARAYTASGYPWFELYDADAGDLAPSSLLAGVRPIPSNDLPVTVPLRQLRRLAPIG